MNTLINKFFGRIKLYGELVMFSHTLFSLPFAMISMLWAVQYLKKDLVMGVSVVFASTSAVNFINELYLRFLSVIYPFFQLLPPLGLLFWILVALFAGRNGANAFNRYVDARFDAKNPRTAHRHIPVGSVSKKETLVISAICFAIFEVAAYNINTLCFLLSPLALALFLLYSYTKRFTWLCHVVLGIACGGAPVGAWLAVTGELSIIPFIIGAAVTFWIGGFDILYGTQDIEFDRKEGLSSIPARFGLNGARVIAAGFHLLAISLLVSIYVIFEFNIFGFHGLNFGPLYLVGLAICAVLLIVEHSQVKPSKKNVMNWVAYHINQIVAIVFFVFSLADLLMHKGW